MTMHTKADLTLTDISVFNGEPTILDLRLAELLGFNRPRDIRDLIKRNIEELKQYGEVCGTIPQTSPQGGRPGTEYHLNEGQALLIASLSKTEKAAAVRFMIITVFLEWRRGTLLPRREPPPVPFEVDIQHAPLSAKTEYLRMVARFRGREAAVAMMPHIGLPDLDAVIGGARISPGGGECLKHLLDWRDEEGDRIRDLVTAAVQHGQEYQKRLMKNGVRAVLTGEPGILVATNTHPVRRIFEGTRWANNAHNAALRGLQGVTACNPVKFDGYPSRTLFIPAHLLT